MGLGLVAPHAAWTRYVGMARAAFRAVRQPSEAMISAGQRSSADMMAGCEASVYIAMINAVLEE